MTAVDSEQTLFDKIIPADAVAGVQLPRPLVFTNGVFDILHRGHVSYLAAARHLGAALMVGVNTDASVRRLGKGAGRPVNVQEDRLLVLAALTSTTAVTLFEEDTPLALIAALRPDIYVKGGDYAIETLAETALVRSWGGTAMALPFVPGQSTSAILRRLGME
ncbi:D-glycero-beta-D-manno-heptose 1-phosphate adenylyltransferase [Croceibacterium ferulae]|uniref:D-glycero-beta-D-manno-heptose 1-phosphate adenylyltransferase n=1 Tax=Croceibacterium ferulae TaxID=1854641 RepID=UPI000EB33164|nr:D-glycero-beta-D-manno-heptose 1-phosphate adenylyltransferase [Croceibacterium ferulae]